VSQEGSELQEVSIDRLLTLSDGVFAIALTLLVLDLHRPTVAHGLRHAVLAQWPRCLSYALSFLIIGIIWAQHHLGYRYIRRTNAEASLINPRGFSFTACASQILWWLRGDSNLRPRTQDCRRDKPGEMQRDGCTAPGVRSKTQPGGCR
jgi:transmembrane protein TMEM174 (potassium channel)